MLLLLALFCGVRSFPQNSSEDLFSYGNSMKFARHLMEEGRHAYALAEYERLAFLAPDSHAVREPLLKACRAGGFHGTAQEWIGRWYPDLRAAPAGLRLEWVRAGIRRGPDAHTAAMADSGLGLPEPERTRMLLHLALIRTDWQAAEAHYDALKAQERSDLVTTYAPPMRKVAAIRYRKPWLGLALSAVVPGAGKAYAGQWFDGLSALMTVGVTAFGAYRVFSKRGFGNALGWGLAGLSLAFYSANLYGSHRAVRRYNEKCDREVLEDVETITHTDL